MENNIYRIIKRPLVTEKSNRDIEVRNAYHFEVDSNANKIEIAKAIEELYSHKGIKVKKVRVLNKKPKKRRFRFRYGYTKGWKKAIVTLDKEYKLEIF